MVVVLARTACPERVVVRRVSCGVEEKKRERPQRNGAEPNACCYCCGSNSTIVPIYLVSHACKGRPEILSECEGRNEK